MLKYLPKVMATLLSAHEKVSIKLIKLHIQLVDNYNNL